MTDRPILFSAPMVRAILDGRKTQTRRILKDAPHNAGWHCDMGDQRLFFVADAGTPSMPVNVPYAVGDRLWVREAWRSWSSCDGIKPSVLKREKIHYEATGLTSDGLLMNIPGKLRPSIFMPRWASRITCLVTDVRVQRVQDIDPDDCYAEGAQCDMSSRSVIEHFHNLWDRINAKRGYGWDVNPWVVAITFDVIKKNIDQMEKYNATD